MIEDLILGLLPAELVPFATIGDLPGTQRDEVCIMLYDGVANTEYFGGKSGSTVFQPIAKIVVRNQSYETAKQWVDLVQETLHRYTDASSEIGGPILSIFMVGSPKYLGRGTYKLHEFQVTFNIQMKE